MDKLFVGDCLSALKALPDCSVHCCVTSPPYWGLRDYGISGQLGQEDSPEEYVERMTDVFREVRRVLTEHGTLWLNVGDCYSRGNRGTVPVQRGAAASANDSEKYLFDSKSARMAGHPTIKPKDLVGIPWRLAFALQEDGWYLRQDIIWNKPNPMPESVTDRCVKSHEYVFLMSKTERYYWDHEASMVPAKAESSGNKQRKDATGRGCPENRVSGNVPWEGSMANRRSVWSITTKPFKGAHFATMPLELAELCVVIGCPHGGVVLDPFFGAGTTGLAASRNDRWFVGIELNPEYARIAEERIRAENPLFTRDMVKVGVGS